MKMTAKMWNKFYKPGTEVYYYPVLKPDFTPDNRFDPKVTETRSVAWEASNGCYVVSIFDKAGWVSLEHLVINIEAIENLRKENKALQVEFYNCRDVNHWLIQRYETEVKSLQNRIKTLK